MFNSSAMGSKKRSSASDIERCENLIKGKVHTERLIAAHDNCGTKVIFSSVKWTPIATVTC
jgi:hypothetical protein